MFSTFARRLCASDVFFPLFSLSLSLFATHRAHERRNRSLTDHPRKNNRYCLCVRKVEIRDCSIGNRIKGIEISLRKLFFFFCFNFGSKNETRVVESCSFEINLERILATMTHCWLSNFNTCLFLDAVIS